MKKLIFSAAALSMIFASCQKQSNTPTTANQPNYSKKTGFYDQQQDGPMRKYVDKGPEDYNCVDEKENCAPKDVVINGVDAMSGLVSAIEQSIYDGYVRGNREALGQFIPVQYLDDVTSGNLRLSIRGQRGAAYRIILFKDVKDAVILAVPVVKK